MADWEYRTVVIDYDGKKHKTWVLEYPGKPSMIGMQAILETHGSQGWELVSLQAEHSEIFIGFGKYFMDPVSYRATFKRPVGK